MTWGGQPTLRATSTSAKIERFATAAGAGFPAAKRLESWPYSLASPLGQPETARILTEQALFALAQCAYFAYFAT